MAVAVVDVGSGGRVRIEAVALDPHAVEARGERVADRTGDAAGEAPIVVIAIGDLAGAAEFERGLLRIDADQAGRRIAAAERALRAALHLDAVRSEEHTSELQSLMRNSYDVFCLKKTKIETRTTSENKNA